MDELTKYYKEALLANLCSEYKGYWQAARDDKEKLITLALCQQSIPHVASFAYQGKGLTKDFLVKKFGEYLNGHIIHDADGVNGYTYSWFVDYDYDNDLVVNVDVAHISWTVGASVVIPQTKAPVIYVSNRSNIHLICEGYNSIKMYLFDKSLVTIEDLGEDSNVIVYKYSDDCNVMKGKYCLGEIKEFRKELRL